MFHGMTPLTGQAKMKHNALFCETGMITTEKDAFAMDASSFMAAILEVKMAYLIRRRRGLGVGVSLHDIAYHGNVTFCSTHRTAHRGQFGLFANGNF